MFVTFYILFTAFGCLFTLSSRAISILSSQELFPLTLQRGKNLGKTLGDWGFPLVWGFSPGFSRGQSCCVCESEGYDTVTVDGIPSHQNPSPEVRWWLFRCRSQLAVLLLTPYSLITGISYATAGGPCAYGYGTVCLSV